VVTVAAFVFDYGLEEGGFAVLAYTGINAFSGAFAGTLRRVDAARRESEALLQELQEAHRQLQEYALRVEELAVVEERNCMAREMHDTIGHRLTVASVQLEGAQLGGELHLEPRRGGGTQLSFRLPLPQAGALDEKSAAGAQQGAVGGDDG
jgi:signal transduction histidine kinase